MKQQNNFSKKPWIPEFFPRGTVVEFDTMVDSQFGTAGVGVVDTITRTHFQNTVLCLKDVTLSKGKFFSHEAEGTQNLSSSYVTKILKRGPGNYVEHRYTPSIKMWPSKFGKRVWQYDVREYFHHLILSVYQGTHRNGTLDVAEMTQAFLKVHYSSDKNYATKVIKKWFLRNYNRFLMSGRDLEIDAYYDDCSTNIGICEDLDPSENMHRRGEYDERRILREFIQAVNQQLHDYKWGVLTKALTEKYLKFGKEIYKVSISVDKKSSSYFFTDIGDLMHRLDKSLLNSPYFEHRENFHWDHAVATVDDLALFEPSEEHGVPAFLGLDGVISYLDYLFNWYDPDYDKETTKDSSYGDMDDGYYSMSDLDFT